MYEVKQETLNNSLRPFDVVRLLDGSIAYINEVSVNSSQDDPDCQISYSLNFLYSKKT